MKKKIVAVALVFALALALGIGGTLAWLTAQSGEVVNTFTVGEVALTLTETGAKEATAEDGTKYWAKAYEGVVPGNNYAKDPLITIGADSEDCYVFAIIVEEHNTVLDATTGEKIVNWSIADGWTPMNGYTNVWYRTTNMKADETATILKDNKVTVSTKLTMDTVGTDLPTLTFTAAAIQSANVEDVTDAWTNLPTDFKAAAVSATPAP